MRSLIWRRGCAALLIAGCLVALALGASAAVVVRRGALAPPWFDRRLGPIHLVGYSTWNASCPPFVGCPPTRFEAYVIWLIVNRPAGNSEPPRFFQFLRLPIEHGR